VLQEFDLDFSSAKSKKYLVFVELMLEFPVENEESEVIDSFRMSISSSSLRLILGMDISLYISRL
jgi:hypothetical protein